MTYFLTMSQKISGTPVGHTGHSTTLWRNHRYPNTGYTGHHGKMIGLVSRVPDGTPKSRGYGTGCGHLQCRNICARLGSSSRISGCWSTACVYAWALGLTKILALLVLSMAVLILQYEVIDICGSVSLYFHSG